MPALESADIASAPNSVTPRAPICASRAESG